MVKEISHTEKGLDVLSEITIWSKYAKFKPEYNRRESWEEIVDRYLHMLIEKYPSLKKDIIENGKYIYDKKVLPSMRGLQFAGEAIKVNHSRIYNCSFLPINHYKAFSEVMFLLLGGSGVGYSVQFEDVRQLPEIVKPTKKQKYVVQDSIVGWADAIKMLMKAYFGKTTVLPVFDFNDIRPKGSRLVTAGGKAPGPEPLKECLFQIQKILDRKDNGEKLTPLNCHDILCFIANAVLAGGIRRAAMIALFSFDDDEMICCKHGNWWELNAQRSRSNNSAVIVRNRITEKEFFEFWKKIQESGSGEPGISFTNNPRWGFNPCHEVSLRPFGFCNLTEINASNITTQEDFNNRARIASFFGTLQAGFTDFHYLRPIWKETAEKDALIGVGITGVANTQFLFLNETEAAKIVVEENKKIANLININIAARCTVIKPSGTTSCVVKSSSGIHSWYSNYYKRTIRFNIGESISQFMMNNFSEICEIDQWDKNTLCVRIPIKSPESSITRDEGVFSLLERVKRFNLNWIKPGHNRGDNYNNVSATISIKPDEWDSVGKWMWENKDIYSGISVLPFDNGTYVQAPFEEITEETFIENEKYLKELNTKLIIETEDNVLFNAESACAGGQCETN